MAAALVSPIAAGCGSNDDDGLLPDEAAITAAVERFQEAMADGDAETICRDLISPDNPIGRGRRCLRLYDKPQTVKLQITSITVNGDEARVNFSGDWAFIDAARVDGDWYISPVN